jgi:8-oxo-dGTP pyrophosphatase MutT (NUDIX family)
MATTAIIAEILIVGLQALAWLTLLIAAFAREWSPTKTLNDWDAVALLLVIGGAYVAGVLIDRVADSLFDEPGIKQATRLQERTRETGKLARLFELGTKRLRVMSHEEGMGTFLEYQRSRLRIARSTVLNLALAAVIAPVFVLRRASEWDNDIAIAIVVMASLLGIAWLTWSSYVRIYGAYLARLSDAYEEITARAESNLRNERVRAAAVCYRQGDRGPEFLLVRTKDGSMWTFPKGHIDPSEPPNRAAAREAAEEAGVIAEARRDRLGTYSYAYCDERVSVLAYLLKVDEQLAPDEEARDPTWLSPADAKEHLAQARSNWATRELWRIIEKAEGLIRATSR